MKQRSAMVVAAGLVVALALAGLGIAMGMTGPSADAKTAGKQLRKPPIVHTVNRTITVHKPGTATNAGGQFATGATTSATTNDPSTGSDDQYEGSFEDSSDDGTELESSDDSGSSMESSGPSIDEGGDD